MNFEPISHYHHSLSIIGNVPISDQLLNTVECYTKFRNWNIVPFTVILFWSILSKIKRFYLSLSLSLSLFRVRKITCLESGTKKIFFNQRQSVSSIILFYSGTVGTSKLLTENESLRMGVGNACYEVRAWSLDRNLHHFVDELVIKSSKYN